MGDSQSPHRYYGDRDSESQANPVTLAHLLYLNHGFEGISIDGKQAKLIDHLHGFMQTEHRDLNK